MYTDKMGKSFTKAWTKAAEQHKITKAWTKAAEQHKITAAFT